VNFLAPHIPAADNENAGAVIEEAKERLAGTGIELDLYSLKIWWGHKWDQDKAVTRIDGTKNMSFPCLSYRGKEFFEDRERAKNFILQGFSGIYTDIECEVYKGCFCERCVNGFRKFMEEKHPELGWIEPKDFAGTVLSPNPENQKAWLEYIGFLMSEYYLSLCDGIGEAAAMLKLTNPPRLTIYNDGDIRAGVAGADLSHLLAQKNPGAEVLCGPPVYSGPAGGGDRVRNLRKTYPETLIYPHIGRAPEIPRFNMEYLVYEIIANGARGFHIYSHTSLDGEELSQLSTSAGVIRKVERFIASSHLLDEPFDPDKDTRIRAIGNNHRMLILVARYQKTGTVEVTVPVEVASSVINLKTGKMLCSIRPGKNTFSVSFDQPGAVLFMVDRQL
jgi:hypothetical protein